MTQKKEYHVIGYPISKSKSPLIHNLGFSIQGLPHSFGIYVTPRLDEKVFEIFKSEAFGGAAITMPFKVEIMKHVDSLTPSAKILGAVNTITPGGTNGDRVFVGDNTDWVGMRNVLEQGLKENHQRQPNDPALVIGAGGAARAGVYALAKLGISVVYIYNRTHKRLEELCQDLASIPGMLLIPISTLTKDAFEKGPPLFAVGTLPAVATTTEWNSDKSTEALILTQDIFCREAGGVMLDMAYLPRRTPLIQVAERATNWQTNYGIQILLQQAFAQYRMWNGRVAPEDEITEVVMREPDV